MTAANLPFVPRPSFARIAAAASGAAALVSLLGLFAGNPLAARIATDGAPLAPVTALGLLLGSVALWLATLRREAPARAALPARLLAAALALGGAAALAVRAMRDPAALGPNPALSASFALFGLALLFATTRTRRHRIWLQLPLLPVLWFSLLSIMTRFYGIRDLNTHFEALLFPVQTALTLFALALGVLAAHPREGVAGIVTRDNTGGALARIALPLMFLLPFTVGWIRMRALLSGYFDTAGAFAQFSTTNVLIFSGFILFSAHVLNRLDARRQATLQSLRAANAELEARIAEQRQAEVAREESERQLFLAQKMEAMGVLASGMAHDFNNILTVILLNAEEAEAAATPDPALRRNIAEIRKSGERAAGLIRQIMAFGRNEPGERRPVTAHEVIEETAQVLQPILPASITLSTDADPGLPEALADAGQLRQVLLNLANNALHAMEGAPGRLEIRADSVEGTHEALPATLAPGRYIRIIVKDTGRGIDADTTKRIFDPFFTTKPPGKGTGLGLSVVHGIMKLHGGAVTVRSEPGKGTEFRLYLPVGNRKSET